MKTEVCAPRQLLELHWKSASFNHKSSGRRIIGASEGCCGSVQVFLADSSLLKLGEFSFWDEKLVRLLLYLISISTTQTDFSSSLSTEVRTKYHAYNLTMSMQQRSSAREEKKVRSDDDARMITSSSKDCEVRLSDEPRSRPAPVSKSNRRRRRSDKNTH